MSPHAVSGRDVRFHSNSATTLTLFCFPPAALCVLDAAHNPNPDVKLSGVQYLKEGEEREIPCIWGHDPHTSLARCTRGIVTLFTCKCRRFHLMTHHVLFFFFLKKSFCTKPIILCVKLLARVFDGFSFQVADYLGVAG